MGLEQIEHCSYKFRAFSTSSFRGNPESFCSQKGTLLRVTAEFWGAPESVTGFTISGYALLIQVPLCSLSARAPQTSGKYIYIYIYIYLVQPGLRVTIRVLEFLLLCVEFRVGWTPSVFTFTSRV